MINRLAEKYGLPCYETPVGFNHIADYMLAGDVLIGGEESGGISIRGHIPEGDGILMGLLLLEIVAHAGVSLHELIADLQQKYGPHHYARKDLPLARPTSSIDEKYFESYPQILSFFAKFPNIASTIKFGF